MHLHTQVRNDCKMKEKLIFSYEFVLINNFVPGVNKV